jgi:hypothetical protein
MRDRGGVDVHADNATGDFAQQRTAVPFAASDVKDAASGYESAREKVSMPVLVRDLALGSRHESFAGEFERIWHI